MSRFRRRRPPRKVKTGILPTKANGMNEGRDGGGPLGCANGCAGSMPAVPASLPWSPSVRFNARFCVYPHFPAFLNDFHSTANDFHSRSNDFHSASNEFHSTANDFDWPANENDSRSNDFDRTANEFHSASNDFHSPAIEIQSRAVEGGTRDLAPHQPLPGRACGPPENLSPNIIPQSRSFEVRRQVAAIRRREMSPCSKVRM